MDLKEAKHPQTILAYEMNGAPLLMNHGEDYRTVGEGHGGYREDFPVLRNRS